MFEVCVDRIDRMNVKHWDAFGGQPVHPQTAVSGVNNRKSWNKKPIEEKRAHVIGEL